MDAGHCTIILGMHRSGTSCLGSLLRDMGCRIGDRLEGPAEGNPHGHSEDQDMLAFHRELIHAETGDPGGVLVPADFHITPGADHEQRAKAMISARATGGWWGWKEPRTCLLADFWFNLLPDASILAIYRHPLAVWDSLLRRNTDPDIRILDDEVFAAYTAYNRSILNVVKRAEKRAFLGHATTILAQPEPLRSFLNGLPGVSPNPPSAWKFDPTQLHEPPITESAHDAFRSAYPAAGAVFDQLQQAADRPLVFAPESSDAFERLGHAIERCEHNPGKYWLPVIMAELGADHDFKGEEIQRLNKRLGEYEHERREPGSDQPFWRRLFGRCPDESG